MAAQAQDNRLTTREMLKQLRERRPTGRQLREWMDEGGCEATDGCWVEPDGHCPHGCPSWMIVLGLI